MDHSSQIRIVDGAQTAVLLLHGIVGTPRHFSHILPLIGQIPSHISYYNLLLPGHGGTVGDFAKSSMQQWKTEVWRVFHELARTHRRVVIVGHSMGTLFALQLAMENPDKVPFLFLIASPICPWVSFQGAICCLRASLGCARQDHPAEQAITLAGGTKLTRKLWCYIPWTANMISLLREADRTKRMLPRLQTQTIVFQSKRDEMVSLRSGKILQRQKTVTLTTLAESTHFYYPQQDIKLVCAAFTDALTKLPG